MIISDNNSIWTQKCILHSSIINGDNEIYVLCDGETKNDSFYINNGINICRIRKHSALYKIPKFGGALFYIDYLLSVKKICKAIGKIDTVHISYIMKSKILAIKVLRKYCNRIICTFWGSDIFRVKEKDLLSYERYLRFVDIIMLTTTEMKERFISVYGDSFCEKMRMLRFGVEALEYIDPHKDASHSKDEYGIPSGKTVVTIGYNGNPNQNHLSVLNSLAMLSNEIKNRIYILLPITYGLSPDYKATLINKLKETGFEYKIFDTFLDGKELGKLRECTDIFIHAQKTDAFSASFQEYLYARKIVFNPIWIPYFDLKDNGVFYYEYSDFDELRNLIEKLIIDGVDKEFTEKINCNTDIIWRLSSWSSVSDKWRKLFDSTSK